MSGSWADLEAAVEEIASDWRAARPERQGRRHLEADDFARLSEAGLLRHFPTKVALLEATLEHHGRRALTQAYAPIGGRTLSFPERVERLATGHETDSGFARLLLVIAAESIESCHPTHDWFVARYDHVRAAWERELAADQGSGMLDVDVDVAVLSRLLVAVFDGAELQFLLAGGRLDIVTPLRHLLDVFYAGRN